MLTTPSARAPALQYLSRRLPKLSDDTGGYSMSHLKYETHFWFLDISGIVGSDMGLMIRAFASALEDDNLLVRRAILDLLLQSLRLDGLALKKAQLEDRSLLMRAAAGVVLRRDSSLNRRLYTWLLGSDEASEVQITYLKTHSLELLTSTLRVSHQYHLFILDITSF